MKHTAAAIVYGMGMNLFSTKFQIILTKEKKTGFSRFFLMCVR